MAQQEDRVMALVEKELDANPNVSNQELLEKAKKLNPAVGRLTLRQFNARYRLQIKRRRARERPSPTPAPAAAARRRARAPVAAAAQKPRAARATGAPRSTPAGVDRDRIRGVFLRFAKDLARAEGKAEMVDLIGSVDKHVDQVIRLASRG